VGNARLASTLAVVIAIAIVAEASGAQTGVSTNLASARWRQGPGTKVSGIVAGIVDALGKRGKEPVVSPVVRIDRQNRLQVRLRVQHLDEEARTEIERAGLEIEIANERLNTVRGWVPAGSVWRLASLNNVQRITPPDYAFTRAGSVEGEHDRVLRCDEVRSTFGVTGSGVRIGVISDGIDHIAASQATGNAPAVTVPVSPRCRAGSGDEGSAIIELIHDCAPGAEIGFCGPTDDLEMIDCIACLHEAFGADVIVDDLGFAGQPVFADGPVAQAVKDALDAGVAYFTAAGNSAQEHYQGRYERCGNGDRHQFATADCTMDFRFVGSIGIVLQWDEPFGSASSNYDLCVPGLGCSEDVQDGDDDPIEGLIVTCNGVCPAGVEIYKRSGADAELSVFFIPIGYSATELLEHRVTTGSIFGHPCVEGAFAVGAIDASRPQQDVIERFSSRGPCTIKFPSFEQRLKPDIIGIDGISNSGPGDFPSPFYGTSASAPGVAAVAALLFDLNPSLTVPDLRRAFENTSVDLGSAGPDITYGCGRADALAAALAVVPPDFVTRTATPSVTATPTLSPTSTVTSTRPPLPTLGPCYGDCNTDSRVVVNELITGVGVVLGTTALDICKSFDADNNGTVTVDELVRSVNAALNGCGG
jgi:subtilisin family serine protease